MWKHTVELEHICFGLGGSLPCHCLELRSCKFWSFPRLSLASECMTLHTYCWLLASLWTGTSELALSRHCLGCSAPQTNHCSCRPSHNCSHLQPPGLTLTEDPCCQFIVSVITALDNLWLFPGPASRWIIRDLTPLLRGSPGPIRCHRPLFHITAIMNEGKIDFSANAKHSPPAAAFPPARVSLSLWSWYRDQGRPGTCWDRVTASHCEIPSWIRSLK